MLFIFQTHTQIKIYRSIILSVVYMGVKLGLSHQGKAVRVFENMVLRKTFGPKTNEVTENWRKLHTEELHVYSLPNIIRLIESSMKTRTRNVPCVGKRGNHRAL